MEKNKLQVKNEDYVLWMKHAPSFQVCFDEASSPAKKCSAPFFRSDGSKNLLLRCLSHSCLCPRADDPAMPGVYLGSFSLPFSPLHHAAHHPQGRKNMVGSCGHAEQTCLSRAFYPKLCPSSACPLCFPGRSVHTALPGHSLLSMLFYSTKTLWHSPGSRNGVVGSQSWVSTVPLRSELA